MLKVSVIIASYNYGQYISQTIYSILNQSLDNFEIIVVDDGSTDNSLEILKQFIQKYPSKIRLLTHPNNENRGLKASLELGILNSKGEYISFCESDDYFHPDNLLLKFNFIDSHSKISLVYSDIHLIGENIHFRTKNYISGLRFFGKYYFKNGNQFDLSAFKFNPIATFSNILCRKKDLTDFYFSEMHQTWSDLQLIVHLSQKGNFSYIQKKLIYWRIHSKSYNFQYKIKSDLHSKVKSFNKDFSKKTNYFSKIFIMVFLTKIGFSFFNPSALFQKIIRTIKNEV